VKEREEKVPNRDEEGRYSGNFSSAKPSIVYRVQAVLTPVFETNINLHKIFKNNNSLMKLSGMAYLYLDFTFSG
jgi:hypothetical protein